MQRGCTKRRSVPASAIATWSLPTASYPISSYHIFSSTSATALLCQVQVMDRGAATFSGSTPKMAANRTEHFYQQPFYDSGTQPLCWKWLQMTTQSWVEMGCLFYIFCVCIYTDIVLNSMLKWTEYYCSQSNEAVMSATPPSSSFFWIRSQWGAGLSSWGQAEVLSKICILNWDFPLSAGSWRWVARQLLFLFQNILPATAGMLFWMKTSFLHWKHSKDV